LKTAWINYENLRYRHKTIKLEIERWLAIQECDFSPISFKFKNELQSNDHQLIVELIICWKTQHKKDLNIIGQFGYNRCLLVFANYIDTFGDIVYKSHWSQKIQESLFEIKLPRVFPLSYILVVQQFPKIWDELNTVEKFKERYRCLIKLVET